jgi:tetratricopeptide (TPR) repeat protein
LRRCGSREGGDLTISRATDMNRKMRRAQAHQAGRQMAGPRDNQQARPSFETIASLFAEAMSRHQAGRPADSLALYDQILALKPDLAEAHGNRGVALGALGRPHEAELAQRRAVALKPDFADAYNNLGILLCERGAHGEGEVVLRRAAELKPAWPPCHLNLATALKSQGKFAAAEEAVHRALALDPGSADGFSILGDVLWCLGRFDDAENALRHAITLRPQFPDALARLGNVLRERGKLDDAEATCRQALALDGAHAGAHSNLGTVLTDQGRLDAAEAAYRRALALQPNFAEAYNNLGAILKQGGRMTEARALAEEAVRLAPRNALHYLNLSEIHRFDAGDLYLTEMEALYQDVATLPVKQQTELNFALAKAYDDVGHYDLAFQRLADGNALKRAQAGYDEAVTLNLLERIRAVFTPDLVGRLAGAGEPSALPVFVIGMPRSGTTLIEQVLASHPQMFGAGELTTLYHVIAAARPENGPNGDLYPDVVPHLTSGDLAALGARYIAEVGRLAPGAARIVNKMPSNFLFAGLIHLALPNARIIHAVRDPVDTCMSCFSKLFASGQQQTYNLAELGRYYRHYQELMAHWHSVLPPGRILDVRYEDMVADLEGEARRLIAHCGLDWDARCLDFHRTARPVRTASAAQVRQPIYGTAVGRGRPYAPFLKPLIDALAGG